MESQYHEITKSIFSDYQVKIMRNKYNILDFKLENLTYYLTILNW